MKAIIDKITKPAAFAALIYIATLSGVLMPISDDAYLHIGDALIYVAAMLLPTPVACVTAAVGAAVADLTLGSVVYVLPTIIIKALTVLAVRLALKPQKTREVTDLLVCLSGIVTVVGYFLADIVLNLIRGTENVLTDAANGMLFNAVQALAAAVVFMMIAAPARKIWDRVNTKVEVTEDV